MSEEYMKFMRYKKWRDIELLLRRHEAFGKENLRPKNKDLQMFLRNGLPFVLLCVFGTFGLTYFFQGKYEMMDRKQHVNEEEYAKYGMDAPGTLEEEYSKMLERDTWADYENKPVPKSSLD
eukprot:TRINITY_DN968_c0_g1_i1.p4 TRINITY_DN968_c0_g1~~TRINITY_DN968_c0_g1_i1.p4  ORF type:complete len:121 (-),score=24.08 TRINITY_DN968_c0_g1_i1:438-800(-)